MVQKSKDPLDAAAFEVHVRGRPGLVVDLLLVIFILLQNPRFWLIRFVAALMIWDNEMFNFSTWSMPGYEVRQGLEVYQNAAQIYNLISSFILFLLVIYSVVRPSRTFLTHLSHILL